MMMTADDPLDLEKKSTGDKRKGKDELSQFE